MYVQCMSYVQGYVNFPGAKVFLCKNTLSESQNEGLLALMFPLVSVSSGTKYSSVDLVKFVEGSL